MLLASLIEGPGSSPVASKNIFVALWLRVRFVGRSRLMTTTNKPQRWTDTFSVRSHKLAKHWPIKKLNTVLRNHNYERLQARIEQYRQLFILYSITYYQ